MSEAAQNRYSQIIERIFLDRHEAGATEFEFSREDIAHVANQLGIKLPKNIGDIVYSFRYRAALPKPVREKAPEGKEWIIRPAGRSRYRFVAAARVVTAPNSMMAEIKVPDSTPGIIAMYALEDEQALLAKIRYNRLIDIFTGITCYSLQSHVRTAVPTLGQVEADEIYIGIDRRGVHYVLPVEAKGANDRIGVIQVEQDIALCAAKFPALVCRPIGAQFTRGDAIALFAFEEGPDGVALVTERHYRLVPASDISVAELQRYRAALPADG